MNKTTRLLLKCVGLVINIIVCLKLIQICDNVPDKWFTTWLWTTIWSYICAIFVTAWIAESIAHWNKE